MSIIIKELFSSDPLSEALEKINFNFDQVVLSGGGPPGPPGDKGSQGISGPKGDDGSRWFTGASTPVGPITDDFWLKPNGSVWKYSSSIWNYTGVSLLGSTGSTGISGSAMEIKIYPGRTGGLLAGSNDSYLIDPLASLAVDNANFNFIVPTNSDKNSLFLGPLNLSNSKFRTWNSLDVIKGTLPSTRMIPKLTMIQNEMDLTGYGGLSIGAKGATSSIISETNPSVNSTVLGSVTNSIIDSRDFFNAGYYIKSPRTDANIYVDQTNKWFHAFLLSMYTMDLDIQAGTARGQNLHSSLGNSKIPAINLKSYRIHLEDFERNRTLYSGYNLLAANNASSYIEINSKPTSSNVYIDNPTLGKTFGYVGLQTQQSTIPVGYAHNYGSVLIGAIGALAYPISLDTRSALNISRPLTKHYDFADATSLDSHITLWSGTETNTDAYIARMSGVRNSTYDGGAGYLQIQSRKVGIVPRLNSSSGGTSLGFVPKFGFHVIHKANELVTSINSAGFAGASTPNSQILGALAGFNSVSGLGTTADTGLAIVNYRNLANEQVWYVGPTAEGNLPTQIGINTYWSGPAIGRWSGLTNPDLHMQVGLETSSGNIAVGFVVNPTAGSDGNRDIRAWSKLAISGSVTIAGTTAYHSRWSNRPTNGLLIEGSIWRGASYISSYFPMNFTLQTGGSIATGYGTNTNSLAHYLGTNPTLNPLQVIDKQIGIVTTKDVLAEGYIAISRQTAPTNQSAINYNSIARTNPAYSLGDYRTGMDMQIMSEGLLVVNNAKSYIVGVSGGTGNQDPNRFVPGATSYASYGSIPTAKFSMRTDFTGLTGAGFQVVTRFATKGNYLTTVQLEKLIKPYYGAMHRRNSALPGSAYHDYQWEGFYLPIPTDSSFLTLDLIGRLANNAPPVLPVIQYQPHTYNASAGLVYSPGPTNIPKMANWLPPTVGYTSGVTGLYGLATAPRNISSLQYETTDLLNKRFQPLPNNLLVTLQEGLYDGQLFTLYISRCDYTNQLTLTGDAIPMVMNGPMIMDDGIAGDIMGGPNQRGFIYDIQRVVLGLDLEQNVSSAGLPYTVVPSTNAITDIAGYKTLNNYIGYNINNSPQILVSTTGTTVNGNDRVTRINPARGSFRFRQGRTITFKWVRIFSSSITSTGVAPDLFTRFSAVGATTINTYPINLPIPNLIDTYEKSQVAPAMSTNSRPQYAWVEVSRSYTAESELWPAIEIAKL